MQLNTNQQLAVETTEGAVLVLAGAGSGKTRVLTERVAHLVGDKRVPPWAILAITFTNKAAEEMRNRIAERTGYDARDIWISTFHAMCVRMLRRYAEHVGYTSNFLIYDSDDSLRLVRKILEEMGLKENKSYNDRYIKNIISRYKNDAQNTEFYDFVAERNAFIAENAEHIFIRYQEELLRQNAMDFDDLLLKTLELLQNSEQARNYYQNKFRYVLVDEYQDTNMVQYNLVKILCGGYGNLFVVGDDDQSIYAFRGANIRNILEFEKDFEGAKVIRLEQNYRSDKRILDVANCVIRNNEGRKGKTLWSEITSGEKPVLYTASSEYDEAESIAREIQRLSDEGNNYSDMAILYRMHTLTRIIEEKLRLYTVPYRIYGGLSFYERKEVKDMIAYLNILANPAADLQLLRIINVPKRAIGDAKVSALTRLAGSNSISMIEVMANADTMIDDAALLKKAKEFYAIYEEMREGMEQKSVHEILEDVYIVSGYKQMLEAEGTPEAQGRMENVEELINSAYEYDERNGEDAGLDGFLQDIALITDMDSMDEKGGVTLMTMHAAKGLEYDYVFVAGVEEGIFPSMRSIEEDNVEEERRLCYVAITRAKKKLYLLHAQMRTLYGKTTPTMPSRFLDEIDDELLERLGKKERPVIAPKATTQKPVFAGKFELPKAKPAKVLGNYKVGTVVRHKSFGVGKIMSIDGTGDKQVAVVLFEQAGQKKMFLAFAALEIL